MSLNLLFFSTICKLCPGDFQAILFWFDIVPESNLIFLRMSWRSQGHTKQVHNISQKFVVFSTICKLRPGDFQAILFWCDIVPKFHLFFFQMSWRSQGHNDVLEVSRILNLLFDTNKYMRIFLCAFKQASFAKCTVCDCAVI